MGTSGTQILQCEIVTEPQEKTTAEALHRHPWFHLFDGNQVCDLTQREVHVL